jgi:hypothetical protein
LTVDGRLDAPRRARPLGRRRGRGLIGQIIHTVLMIKTARSGLLPYVMARQEVFASPVP